MRNIILECGWKGKDKKLGNLLDIKPYFNNMINQK